MKHFSLMLVMVLFSMSTILAQRTVTGTVLLDGEEEAIGANVVIDGDEGVGTVTEFDGTFSLSVPETAKALKISYTGFVTKVVSIDGVSELSVTLSRDNVLETVVVVGYSAVKPDQISSGISVVDAEEIQNVPVANIGNLLQGKATGVQVTSANGKPGGGTYIRIRGVNSIASGNEPLFVVDGIPVTSSVYNAINPSDIATISVLKDAAAATIYGSTASNGVVLVTTKKGSSKSGRPQISFKTQYGFKQKTQDPFEMMNAQQKMDYETELFQNYGIGDGATVASYEVPAVRDSLLAISGDWQDILLRTGTFQNHDFSMSGGDDKVQYFASVGYFSEEGIAKGSSFNRMTARINASYKASDWLTLSNTIYVARTNSDELRDRNNVQNPFRAMYDYNPYESEYLLNSPDATDILIDPATGKPQYNLTHAGFSISEAIENNPENEVEHHLIGSLAAEFKILPIKGLSFRTEVNGNLRAYEREYFIKPNSVLDSYVGDPDNPGIGTANFSRRWQYQFKNLVKYTTTINEKHNVTALVGQEFQDFDSYAFRVSGNGFPNEALYTLNNAAIVDSGSSSRYEEAVLSAFTNINYNYDSKYIASFTYRTDGFSGFGSDHRFGHFFSGSVGWNLHYEDFFGEWFKENISQLKLRLSVGQTGNRNGIGSYDRLATVAASAYAGTSSLVLAQSARPDLRWEKAFSPSLGLDFGLFNNRIAGSLDLYSKKITDLFAFEQFDDPDFFASVRANVGEMRNKGAELELNVDVVRLEKQNFTVSLFGSMSYNSNEVLALPDDDGNPETPSTLYNGTTIDRVGYETNTFYLVRSAGVDPATGDELWYDVDGNITNVWSGDDAVALEGKTPQPKYQGGFGTNIKFKGLTVGATFYYQMDSYVMNYMASNMLSDGENIADNQRVDATDFWRNPGDITNNPRPTGVSYTSDRFLQRNDYLRLRDVRVGYTIPVKSKWLTSVNVFVQGTNLATWSSFDGDPEVGVGSGESDLVLPGQVALYSYPASRGLTFGLDVNF
jgi:TonB-linked SusC/RagA family outer membrane protein